MVKFENLFGNLAWIGLVALALFSIVILVQGDNNASQPLINDALFNSSFGGLNDTIGALEGVSSTQYSTFSSEKPKTGFGSIVLFTIVSAGKTFSNVIFAIFTIVIKLPLVVLGIDPTITAMIVSLLTITVIISLWIVYKFGG